MDEPTGYFFLLPCGEATKKICIGEVGGPSHEVTADQVIGGLNVADETVELVQMLRICANPNAFDNGVTHAGMDQGDIAAWELIDRVERALNAAGYQTRPERAFPIPDDPFSEGE